MKTTRRTFLKSGAAFVALATVGVSFGAGRGLAFKSSATNAGPVTLSVRGIGVKKVFKHASQPLAAGDIGTGQRMLVTYDGESFRLSDT